MTRELDTNSDRLRAAFGSRKNIWGKEDCELPSGQLCDACCQHYEVLVGNKVKPENTPCPYQNRVLDEGRGCNMHGQFYECKIFHCSNLHQVNPNRSLKLIATARSNGDITDSEAESAVQKISTELGQEQQCDEAIEFVLDMSDKISRSIGEPHFVSQ